MAAVPSLDLIHVGAALASALLHAGWNAAVKNTARPAETMSAQMVLAAVLVVPVLMFTGLPAAASLPWLVASTSLNLVTVLALLRAYDHAGFGVAYPVIRAISVLLIVPISIVLAGETVSALGLAGVGLIALALAVLGLSARGKDALTANAAGWMLLSGVTAAAYVYCDARGVRASGSALGYGSLVSITNAVAMVIRQRATITPLDLMRRHWRPALPIAVASVASYFLILWAYTGAPIAPMAALRDTSAVFAILIALFWLKEAITPMRLLAVAIAAAAIPLLRLS